MINFFKKENMETLENPLTKIAALLIHVAKIDENYTKKEREIIKKAIIEIGAKNEMADSVLIEAEKIEKESNQILNFTKEVKNLNKVNLLIFSLNYFHTYQDYYLNKLCSTKLQQFLFLNLLTDFLLLL